MSDRDADWPGQGWPPPPGRPPPPGSEPPPDPGDSPFEPRRPRSGPLRRLGRWAVLLFVFQLVLIASLNLWRPTYSALSWRPSPTSSRSTSRSTTCRATSSRRSCSTRTRSSPLVSTPSTSTSTSPGWRGTATVRRTRVARPSTNRSRRTVPVARPEHPAQGARDGVRGRAPPLVEDVKVLEPDGNLAESVPTSTASAQPAGTTTTVPRTTSRSGRPSARRSAAVTGPRQQGRGEPGGGIDTSVDGDPTSAYTVANAKKKLPPYFDRHGLSFVRAARHRGHGGAGGRRARLLSACRRRWPTGSRARRRSRRFSYAGPMRYT